MIPFEVLILGMSFIMAVCGVIFMVMHSEKAFASEFMIIKTFYVIIGCFTLFISIAFCALIVKVLGKSYKYYLIN